MEKHRTIAGGLQFIQAAIFALLSILVFTGFFRGVRPGFLGGLGEWLSQLGSGAGFLCVILALAFVIAGVCLIKGLTRARPFIWIMAVVGLFLNSPLGLAIGAYTIWVLVKKP